MVNVTSTGGRIDTHSVQGMRVALIGAGGIAHVHLPAWLALGAQVSVFALEGTEQLIKDCGGGRACTTLAEALLDVEAVDIAVPTSDHHRVLEQSLTAGVDVFCEKPLGRTAEQARSMINSCRTAGVQLYPGHVVRFFPEFALMHEQVAAGAVGEIAVQRFSRIGSRPRMDWFHDEALSGGIVLDQIIHDLDFACWNAGPAVRVFARLRRTGTPGSGTPGSGIDTGQVVLTHASGAISYVVGIWARPGTTFRTTFEIAGTNGLLRHDSTEHQPLVVDSGSSEEADALGPVSAGTGLLPAPTRAESPFLTEIREIARSFRGGPPPRVDALDGLRAVILAEAANRSIAEGRAIEIDAELGVAA